MDFSFTRTNVNPYSEAIYVGDAHGSARRWLLRIGARTPAGKVPCRDGDTQTEGDAYEEVRWGGVVAWCLSALCAATMLLPAQKVYAAEGNLALTKKTPLPTAKRPIRLRRRTRPMATRLRSRLVGVVRLTPAMASIGFTLIWARTRRSRPQRSTGRPARHGIQDPGREGRRCKG